MKLDTEMKNNLIILLACVFIGCGTTHSIEDTYHVNPDMTSNEDYFDIDLPREELLKQYFLEGDDGYVYLTSGSYLGAMYNRAYKSSYNSYEEFISSALSDKLKLRFEIEDPSRPCYADFTDRFRVDEKIMGEYAKGGARVLLEKYLYLDDKYGEYIFRLKWKERVKRMTIAYCLWKEGYRFEEDCYAPAQKIVPPKDVEELDTQELSADVNAELNPGRGFFISQDDGYVYLISNGDLKLLYEFGYLPENGKEKTFDEFRVGLLTGMINYGHWVKADGTACFDARFVKDNVIMEEYRSGGIKAIVQKYCKYDAKGHFTYKEKYPLEKKLTIAYYLWQNGLIYIYGGYGGEEYFL
jgi:hypothetical protein